MIVTCPNCTTRYVVDASAIGPAGRRVKCVRCAHLWVQHAPATISAAPAASRAAPATAAPTPPSPPAQQPRQMPKGSNLPAPIVERRANASATAWAVMIMTIGGLAAILYFARDDVVRVWPQSMKLYETLGVPVSGQTIAGLLDPGLELRDINVARGRDLATIVVSGTIINPTTAPRAVTALEARLLSGTDEELAFRRFEVTDSTIPAGGSLSFQHELRDLPDGVARIRMIIAAS